MVYRHSSNSSEDNNHLSQFILHFSVDREVIFIGEINLLSINWDNVHLFQDHFESTTQVVIDAFVSSGLSQWVTESMYIRSGNILHLVFTSAIDRIGNVNIHCTFSHCRYCPIVLDYVFDFSHELTPKNLFKQAWI